MWIYLVTRLNFCHHLHFHFCHHICHHPASPPSTALNWTTLSAVGGTKRDRWERASLRIFASALLIAFFSDTFWQIYRPPTPLRWSLFWKKKRKHVHCLGYQKTCQSNRGSWDSNDQMFMESNMSPKKDQQEDNGCETLRQAMILNLFFCTLLLVLTC